MILSNCRFCGSKKSRSIKEQETRRISNSSELKTSLSTIHLVGPILFKINEIINKFLLAADKLVPEIGLRHPGFTYIVCGLFTKNKKRFQKFKGTGDSKYIYQNELDEACFQHDMA